jgi:hypothetical protein
MAGTSSSGRLRKISQYLVLSTKWPRQYGSTNNPLHRKMDQNRGDEQDAFSLLDIPGPVWSDRCVLVVGIAFPKHRSSDWLHLTIICWKVHPKM